MLLIDLLGGLLIIALLYLIFTQFLLPAIRGTRLFPDFRKSPVTPLQQKVEIYREEVGIMREQNNALTEMQQLLKQRAELEKKIKALEPAPSAEAPTIPAQSSKE